MRWCAFDLETRDSGWRPEGFPAYEPADGQAAEDQRGFIQPWLGSVLTAGLAWGKPADPEAWVGAVGDKALSELFKIPDSTGGQKGTASLDVEYFESEKALLSAIWLKLKLFEGVATWRGEFDWTWLEFRSAVRRVKRSRTWFHTRYDRRSKWIDWADMLAHHGAIRPGKGEWSLPACCQALATWWRPYLTGAEILGWIAEDRMDEVIKHQAYDVLATIEVHHRCAPLFLKVRAT